MSNPSTTKITFAKDTKDDKPKKTLPKFASYTTPWIKKPKDYPHTTSPSMLKLIVRLKSLFRS